MIALIIAYIVFNIYASISGFKDAVTYSLKGAAAFPWNEHNLFMSERIAVVCLIVCGSFIERESLWVLITCITLSFSFWHNGFYYEGRSFIDVERYNFNSNSTSSSAKVEIKWWMRLTMKIISILILTLYTIFYEQN
jgi:hypothetical protein